METAAFLLKTANLVITITGSSVFKEILSIKDYEKDTKKMAETIRFIGDVLSGVEGRQTQEADVIDAYNRLRNAYLDSQDFLDEVETKKKKKDADDREKKKQAEKEIIKIARQSLAVVRNKTKPITKKASNFFFGWNPIKVHNAIKEIRQNLDTISQDIQKFGLREINNIESTGTRARETASFVNAGSIIGREEDKRRIIEMLLGASDDHRQIPVISIVGIGGMGKTTVARLVYNDESVKSCKFELKLWVSDSQKFDLKLLLQKILQSISPSDASLHNLRLDPLMSRLKMEIEEKKYLIVLDDVKNESFREWKDLRDLLELGAKGSRILVTTRSRTVAEVMSSDSTTYGLKCLSDKDSWSLFEILAFEGSKDEDLVRVGEGIVQKCGGVPLAIMTVGCLLRCREKPRWEQVRDNELARIQDDSNDIIPILRISYDDLDPKSKECFRYCALFPKNWPISKEILMSIWMANVSFKLDAEDACEETIRTLYNRCFLDEEIDQDATYYRIHDLMLDLAREVAGADMFLVDSDVIVDDSGTLTLDEYTRHLNLRSTIQTVEQISRFEANGRRLRTLLHHDIFDWRNPWYKLLRVGILMSDFPVLRMLDLQKSRLDSLPDSIGSLIHLRYLNLCDNEFHTLPGSIAELWNLQSLLLKSCNRLKELPVGIRKLINLGHLNLEGCNALTHMPSGMDVLKFLRTLNMFIVGDSESEHTAKLEDLEPLSKLQGDLIIKLPEKSTMTDEGGFLLSQKRLRTLKIEWPHSRYDPGLGNDMYILGKLQPHSDLDKFTLYGYEGLRFPHWADDLASLLPKLVSIIIDSSGRCQHLPSFSKLGCLKHLSVCNLPSLEYMEEETDPDASIFFPSLEEFWLMGLEELKGWCSLLAGTANHSLEEKSYLLPSLRCLSDLHIYGCPKLDMRSMPASPVGQYNVKVQEDTDLTVTVQEALSSRWGMNPFKSERDSIASLSSVSLSAKFHAHDPRLCIYTPWEHCLHGNPMSLVIEGFNVFKFSPAGMAEAFRRMSKCLTFLEIKNMPGLKTFPQVLQHLTVLRELYINGCLYLKCGEDEDIPNHSHSTSLESLRRLTLCYLPRLRRLPIEIQSVTSLQMLQVTHCPNITSLSMGLDGLVQMQSNLAFLGIDDCLRNQPLPSLTQLRCLKHLSLRNIRGLEYIQENTCAGAAFFFPSLESILVQHLPNLRDWCRGLPTGVCWIQKQQSFLQSFPRLSRIGIYGSPDFDIESMLLSSATLICYGTSWEQADFLTSSGSRLSCELHTDHLPIFKTALLGQYLLGNPLSVVISDVDDKQDLTKLDDKRIIGSLTSLKLVDCPSFKTLTKQLEDLTALQKLSIERCEEFTCEEVSRSDDETQWGGFKKLTHLEFANLPKMVRLPEWIQCITSLQEVHICGCNNLVVPEWVHTKFDYVKLPEQQGFRLVMKS